MPSGYLDTSLVSGLAKEDLGVELGALRQLLGYRKSGAISLCTSRVTKDEIERIPAAVRARHEEIYSLIDDVPEAGEHLTIRMLGRSQALRGPQVIEDADLARLRSILPDENDARHVFQAIKNGVDYFVTADVKTSVSRATIVEKEFAIRIRTPSQLLAELS